VERVPTLVERLKRNNIQLRNRTSPSPVRANKERIIDPKIRHPTKLKLPIRVDSSNRSNSIWTMPSNNTAFASVSGGSCGSGGKYSLWVDSNFNNCPNKLAAWGDLA
jgi:hypothetical protein